MTVLYISEYKSIGWVGNSNTQLIHAPSNPVVAEQHVSVSGASAQSAAFNAETKFVRVVSDVACNIAFGTDPVAVTTAHYLPANAIEFYAVVAGTKLAVIPNS